MYSLIVDSSTKRLYISLVNDNTILFEKYIEGRNDHAKNIVSTIEEALKLNNITLSDIDNAITGVGPGSYTGVRMAVTVMKMLAVFMKAKLYTISTLELMASGTKENNVLAMIDARRGNSFAGIYDIINNKHILEDGYYSNEELNKYESTIINDDNYIVDPLYVINNKVLVEEPHLLVPNYLRDTEAERNLK